MRSPRVREGIGKRDSKKEGIETVGTGRDNED
jgi:hypothetical protein